jgi:hypothetical protein
MKNNTYIFLMFLTIFLFSCNNDDFSPIKETDQFPITYCLLDTRAKEQIVLIQRSSLGDSTKLQTEGIEVSLIENSGAPLKLRDTTIPGLNNYKGYYSPGFKIKRNSNYRLVVEYNGISEYADVFVPQKTPMDVLMKFDTTYVSNRQKVTFICQTSVSRSAPNINTLRFFLDYENSHNGTIIRDTIQVPIKCNGLSPRTFWYLDEDEPFSYEYVLSNSVTLSYLNFNKGWDTTYYKPNGKLLYSVKIPLSYWRYLFDLIREGTTIGDITIKGAFAVFYSIDNFYYENYMQTNYEEPYVVRLDAPYIPTNFKSNINRPLGYFSILTADTTKFLIDPYLVYRSYFRDGQ